ncbi:Alkylphosphonate utilization protein [Comamonas aquatilis]
MTQPLCRAAAAEDARVVHAIRTSPGHYCPDGNLAPFSSEHLNESDSLSHSTLPSCPQCGLDNTYPDGDQLICPDCAHEWSASAPADDEDNGPRVIKDANGAPLADGDSVLLVKDLKVKGSSTVIKKGTKIKGIRLVYDNGDHDVDCKTDQGPFILKSEFLKKA